MIHFPLVVLSDAKTKAPAGRPSRHSKLPLVDKENRFSPRTLLNKPAVSIAANRKEEGRSNRDKTKVANTAKLPGEPRPLPKSYLLPLMSVRLLI